MFFTYKHSLYMNDAHNMYRAFRNTSYFYFFSDMVEQIFGEGNGTPLQYSCLKNPMDGGAWWAAVHGVTKSWTQLSDYHSLQSQVKKQPLETDMEQWTGSKLGKEYINAIYFHSVYLTYMQSTSSEMPG